ncbi:hypothetical protein [Mycobacterium conspicuum]|jgi:hypothetical protein|uniref:Uncharacterized protein n=1 Tax=Mycobacterium conspicuum TaxID=44010 RepID=A0A1X1TH03_9MYCO|nr:hypothetical protein [Mycobacterium conspicuum]ORV43790.1 hypothetical protein AWC00_08755 [Mycobacterium conspicuum]BBZ38314.1 hypothetical protein MCNS_13770 [Mycobacterium conspicuum]
MSIDWESIGQVNFDRVIEALILRRHRGTNARVRAVNGRGGDSGIDIEVIDDGRLIIYQLKYFPGGFSGGWRTRRPQIKESFETALENDPDVWTLVIPSVATTPEHNWVRALAVRDGPEIEIMDRDELDNLLADFPDVDRWFQRDAMREYAELYGQERACLFGGIDDLAQRVQGLGGVVDSTDPDWTFDFARVGDCTTWSLRPQHERAHINSPVSLRVAGDLEKLPMEARETIDRAILYGTSDAIAIPGAAVTAIHIEGPKFIAGDHPPADVRLERLSDTPGVGKLLELRLFDTNGENIASHEGCVTHADIGTAGGSIEGKFCDERLHLKFLIPFEAVRRDEPTRVKVGAHMTVDLSRPGRPVVVQETLALARLVRFAPRIEVHIDGQLVTSVTQVPGIAADNDTDYLIIEQLAEDLDIVQRYCGQFFDLPAEVTFKERVELRVARLLVQGHIVAHPGAKELAFSLDGQDSEELRVDLSTPRLLVLRMPSDHEITVGGRTLSLGPVYVIDPAATPVNGAEAIAALDRGEGNGFVVRVRPATNPYFCLALANKPAEELDLRQQAMWSLIGVDQPQAPGAPAAEAS